MLVALWVIVVCFISGMRSHRLVVGHRVMLCRSQRLLLCCRIQGVSQPKMGWMGHTAFGGAGMSAALITCHNEILGKSGAVRRRFPELHRIWRHYCTMMTNSASGFYKKPSRPVFSALSTSVRYSSQTMSNDCEVQELVREIRDRGLQHLLSTPPVQSYLAKYIGRQEFSLKLKSQAGFCSNVEQQWA